MWRSKYHHSGINNGAMEKTKYNISPARLSIHIYLLELLCEFAGAVMDREAGDLLHYCHLRASSMYKDDWGRHQEMKSGDWLRACLGG